MAGEEFAKWEPYMGEPCKPGASGGSILVSSELFFNVGGFDPELFTEYSVEDQFFFDKLCLKGCVGFCDYPAIELLHLSHENNNRITKMQDWDAFYSFKRLSEQAKTDYIEMKSLHLKSFL